MEFTKINRNAWIILVGLLVTAVIVVWLAPIEQTLGQAIKYVYVHVALTRAGIYGFYLAGLVGLGILVTENRQWQAWNHILGWVALAFFLAGGIASMFAQTNSWGGIFWREPRNMTTLNIIALALIVLILAGWFSSIRLCGLLSMTLAVYTAWVIPRTPLVLHPQNAAGSSPSTGIQFTFIFLTLLTILMVQIGALDGLQYFP